VPKKTAYFPQIMREGFLRRAVVKRIARSGYNRDTFLVEDNSYACEERGLEGPLDDADREFYASDFDAESVTTQTIMRRVLQEYEIDVAAAIFNTTSWTGATLTTAASGYWSTLTTNIISDLSSAKNKVRVLTGLVPNTLVVSKKIYDYMLQNEYVIERIQFSERATEESVGAALSAVIGLPKVLVGKGVYNSAKEGQTASISDIWDDGYAMVCVTADQGSSIATPCVGRTFVWSADAPAEAGGVIVEQYRDETVRSDIFRARMHSDELVFDPSFGHLISGVTA